MLIRDDFTKGAEMNGARQTQSKQIRRKRRGEGTEAERERWRENRKTKGNSFPLFDLKIKAFLKSKFWPIICNYTLDCVLHEFSRDCNHYCFLLLMSVYAFRFP